MKIAAQILILIVVFSSCQRRIASQPSILEAYKQYRVLVQLKKELQNENLNLVRKEELIAVGEELAPNDAEIKLMKASVFRRSAKPEKAMLALESAMDLSPTYSPSYSAYGELLIENGFNREGKIYCLHAVKLNPINLAGRNCSR